MGASSSSGSKTFQAPEICSLHVQSNIRYRYAHTRVRSEVCNTAHTAQEVTFSMTLPETAFISSFSIEIDGKVYSAYVKEKEKAAKEYAKAVKLGNTAAHVAVSARDSNQFTVAVNIKPGKKMAFNLAYEELLSRRLGVYKHAINLNPKQVVEDFSVQIIIEESTDITTLEVFSLKDVESKPEKNPFATIEKSTPHSAVIKFAPTSKQQRELAIDGIPGQLVIQYDVDRSSFPSQIMVNDGYFAHFFAPEHLKPLPKHVTFVLDVSSSMGGHKIQQLKEAMNKILSDLLPQDHFSLLCFNHNIKVWRLTGDGVWDPASIQETDFKHLVIPATADNVLRGKLSVFNLYANGSTNIHGAMMSATHVAQLGKKNESTSLEPIIIFLTDGQPTDGQCNIDQIINDTTQWNQMCKATIFALGLGSDVDFEFLKRLALRNSGYARKIYEASDTSLQLADFYKEVSSPLLSNVMFIYQPEQVISSTMTRLNFPTFYRGTEFIVCGGIVSKVTEEDFYYVTKGCTAEGMKEFHHKETQIVFIENTQNNTGFMERMWAYLTIQQLLEEEKKLDGNLAEQKNKQATQMALKYSFVTPVTSLIVVQPDGGNVKATNQDVSEFNNPGCCPLQIKQKCKMMKPQIYRSCRPQIRSSLRSATASDVRSSRMNYCSVSNAIGVVPDIQDVRSRSRNYSKQEMLGQIAYCYEADNFRDEVLRKNTIENEPLPDFDLCDVDIKNLIDQITGIENPNVADRVYQKIYAKSSEIEEKLNQEISSILVNVKLDIITNHKKLFLCMNVQYIQNAKIIVKTCSVDETEIKDLDCHLNSMLQTCNNKVLFVTVSISKCKSENSNSCTKNEGCSKVNNFEISDKVIKNLSSAGISGDRCPIYTMQLAVQDSLKSENAIIATVKDVIKNVGLTTDGNWSPKCESVDHWRGAYIMLQDLLQRREKHKDELGDADWKKIQDIIEALNPVKNTMERLETDQVTFGDLYGSWIQLSVIVKQFGTSFAETLSINLEKRITEVLQTPLFIAVLFLDPRHRSKLNDSQRSTALEELKKVWNSLTKVWGIDGIVGSKEIEEILERYQNLPQAENQQDVLQYWESQKELQPMLCKIAEAVLSIPVTEATVHRVNSNLKILLSELPDKVKAEIIKIRCFNLL